MQIVKLYITDSELCRNNKEKVDACVAKMNSIFKYKGFILNWMVCKDEYGSIANMESEGKLPYINKEESSIGCSFSNTDTLGLDIIIGLGELLDYNIQDITDIRDSKLSIEREDLVNFANIPLFAENPCILELKELISKIPESEEETLLKQKSEHISNIKRYDFMIYNYLNFRFHIKYAPLSEESTSLSLNAYNELFDTRNTIAQRVAQSADLFQKAITAAAINNEEILIVLFFMGQCILSKKVEK